MWNADQMASKWQFKFRTTETSPGPWTLNHSRYLARHWLSFNWFAPISEFLSTYELLLQDSLTLKSRLVDSLTLLNDARRFPDIEIYDKLTTTVQSTIANNSRMSRNSKWQGNDYESSKRWRNIKINLLDRLSLIEYNCMMHPNAAVVLHSTGRLQPSRTFIHSS